jgi:hypothetical protein
VDLGAVGGEDDRAVHLRQLVEERRGVVHIELDPSREQEGELLGLANADQGPCAGLNYVVETFADRGARRHRLQRADQPGFLPSLELSYVVPGIRH